MTVLHKVLQKYERETISSEALQALASAVLQSRLVGKDIRLITAKLAGWTKKERRYNTLIKDLKAVGSIVLLPHDIDDSMRVLGNCIAFIRLMQW